MSRLPLKSCLTISRLANFAWHSWKFVPTRGRGGVAAVINDFFAFDTNWKSARRKCKQWEKTTACKSLGSCRKLKLTSLKPELTLQSGENITKSSHKAAKLYFYFPYQFGLVQFEARSQENMCTLHSVYCLWASVSAGSICSQGEGKGNWRVWTSFATLSDIFQVPKLHLAAKSERRDCICIAQQEMQCK